MTTTKSAGHSRRTKALTHRELETKLGQLRLDFGEPTEVTSPHPEVPLSTPVQE